MSEKVIIDHEALSRERQREEIAELQATDLMRQWECFQAEKKAETDAHKAQVEAHDKFTRMLAEALRVKIGMRVSVTKSHGYGQKKTMRTTVYEVTYFSHYRGATLNLKGKTVLKSGALGEVRDIDSDWQRVE